MITVHHLGRSQSERIVWLCEELGLNYALKRYDRVPETKLAPPDYKALHPTGAAPVIADGTLVLAESGAIVDYILAKHGGGRLQLPAKHPDFASYLYWFHYANGGLQPMIGRLMFLRRLAPPSGSPVLAAAQDRLAIGLRQMDARLGGVPWLAGAEFTAADIMSVFSLTTMRLFEPFDIAPYNHILGYLQRVGARPAYRAAMQKADPGMPPVLGTEIPKVSIP